MGIKTQRLFVYPSEYSLKFYENFWDKQLNNWVMAGSWWGQKYHPNLLWQWYDDSQIQIVRNGVQFSAAYKPFYFEEIDKIIPMAIGIIRTKKAWKYGIFSFTVKLPSGSQLWPALWLSGATNWPPEIDLLEGYSDNTVNYHNNIKLQSCIHIKGNDAEHINCGARSHRIPNDSTSEFIKYIIWWEKDFLKLYYNGYLVRHITDNKILDKLDEEMHLIIGTGTQEEQNQDNLSPMIVKEIKIYQK